MSTVNRDPKLIFPGLAGFYAAVSDLWFPMIRITVGGAHQGSNLGPAD